MQSHHLPDGKEFIVLVDFFSDFIEVKHLQEHTSSVAIELLKEQFSRYTAFLVTDNGHQFQVMNFNIFRVIGSFYMCRGPHTDHQSYGKVESAVKVATSLHKKAQKDNKDSWLTILDQRNTPSEVLGTSPAQRLMNRHYPNLVTHSHYPVISQSSC